MKYKSNLLRIMVIIAITAVGIGAASGSAFAQGPEVDVLNISVTSSVVDCGDVQFDITIHNGAPPYLIGIDYGDGDASEFVVVASSFLSIIHTYYDAGDYELFITAEEQADGGWLGSTSGAVTLNGPAVTLTTEPPVALFVMGEAGEVEFFTDVTGGTIPTTYQWDLDGDGFSVCASPVVDCDDSQVASFPGNPEICDGVDNNCDGTVDEGCSSCLPAGSPCDYNDECCSEKCLGRPGRKKCK